MSTSQSKSLRETVLEQQLSELQRRFVLMNQAHLMTLTTLIYYVGGEVTLSQQDYQDAKGLLLTEEMDQAARLRTFRTRRVGQDEPIERGGLLPPNARGETWKM